jgi:iron(III) transport system permease protein
VLIDLSEEGDFERLAALGIVMLVLTLGLVLIGYGIVGQRILTRTE